MASMAPILTVLTASFIVLRDDDADHVRSLHFGVLVMVKDQGLYVTTHQRIKQVPALDYNGARCSG